MNIRYIMIFLFAINITCSIMILYSLICDLSSVSTSEQIVSSNLTFTTSRPSIKFISGFVTKQQWNQIHDSDINRFLNHPLFPYYPISETRIAYFSSHICTGVNTGVRVFGWITPSLTGFYSFLLYSTNNAKFLIYMPAVFKIKTKNKRNFQSSNCAELQVPNNKKDDIQSQDLFLEGSVKYFFEIFHLQKKANCSFSLLWKSPADFTYRMIDRQCLSTSNNANTPQFDNYMNLRYHQNYFMPKYNFQSHATWSCDVNLSYVTTKRLKVYDGVNQKYLQEIWVEIYPRDASWDAVEICDERMPVDHCVGNYVVAEEEASRIVEMFMIFALDLFDGDCEIVKLIRIERHKDKPHGRSRIFLELILRQPQRKKNFVISSYFFEKINGELCYAFKYEWKPFAKISIIVTVKNQRPWLKYLLNLIRKISLATNDENIELIVADFDSDEEELNQMFIESGLSSYQIIPIKQSFIKLKGIQAGLDLVHDPNNIVLLMDLHMEIPYNFFHLIRKHCIKGKMAFNPIVLRLSPGHYSINPAGFWEIMGFGVIAMYKEDWLKIRRLDNIPAKQSWGGEDWQIVDYIVMAGIEISRFRVPGFFHYYHTHEHLWDGSNDIDKKINSFK